jgi:hypothetical protein
MKPASSKQLDTVVAHDGFGGHRSTYTVAKSAGARDSIHLELGPSVTLRN